jgi:hypothetical protein
MSIIVIHILSPFPAGCSLFPDDRIVLSCYANDTVSFINKEGVELFQIDAHKAGTCAYDTVYIKDNNSVAVSSGNGDKICITIIDIESQKVVTTISMDTHIYGMAISGRTVYYCTVHGDSCHDFLTFYVYYSYAYFISIS